MGMIAYLRGILAEKEPTRAVVEAAGVGYELAIPVSTFDRLPRAGEEVKLLVSHIVREDDEMLFGFRTENERDFFTKLTGVSGVGPKIALAILSGISISELSMSIAAGDHRRLSAIKGVGKKTAEKICVELKDKVNPFVAADADGKDVGPAWLADAVQALRSLGFNEAVSTKMVADVVAAHPEADDVEKVLRLALKGK